MTSAMQERIQSARCGGDPDAVRRARAGLLAWQSHAASRDGDTDTIGHLADGTAATGIATVALAGTPRPKGLDCAQGCAFCCILTGDDGGTMTEAEARALHRALSPLAGAPDGRGWHPHACPALDPESRTCRAYDARPMICRSYVSTNVSACQAVSAGRAATGAGTLSPYHTYLAALGLARGALKGVRRVSTYALSRVAAAAVAGQDIDTALRAARHKPGELDAELRRSRRDTARAQQSGLP